MILDSEEYAKLKARVESLPLATVEAAAGWSLRYMSQGKGGMDLAMGLLALKSPDPGHLLKAMHLSFANVESLMFLNSALDVAQVLHHLPMFTPDDLAKLRISKGAM